MANSRFNDFINGKIFRYLVLIIIAAIVFLLFYFFVFSNYTLVGAADSSFVTGAIIFCLGFFQILSNQGMFDIVSYGFANMYSVMKKEGTKRYTDLYEYKEMRKEARKRDKFNFLPYLIIGSIILVVGIILTIIVRNTIY